MKAALFILVFTSWQTSSLLPLFGDLLLTDDCGLVEFCEIIDRNVYPPKNIVITLHGLPLNSHIIIIQLFFLVVIKNHYNTVSLDGQ